MLRQYSKISKKSFDNKISKAFSLFSSGIFLLSKNFLYTVIIFFCKHGDKSKESNLNKFTVSGSVDKLSTNN